VAVLASAVSIAWALGELTQKPGKAGCVSEDGTGGKCEDGTRLVLGTRVAVSPDGKNLYAAGEGGIAIFKRDPATGAITQLPGLAGCISDRETRGECQNGKVISGPEGIAVSPDGENVYVAAENSDAIAILDRHSDQEGGLTQKQAGTAGCISEAGTNGQCLDGKGLKHPFGVAVSPDGENVYIASAESEGVAVFNRHSDQEGVLTQQQAGTAGCITETGSNGECDNGKALEAAIDLAISPDGENVYVAALESDAVAVLQRHADQGGALAQKQAGTAGCISETGTNGECENGKALEGPAGLVVSPDGKGVYVAAAGSGVPILDRHPDQEGALTQQQAGTAGCISETGTNGECQDGKALLAPHGIAISPDGSDVYVASFFSSAVSSFTREQEGNLTQKPGAAGCISETGTNGQCDNGKALENVEGVAVSPDKTSVYATAFGSSAVSIFDRATATSGTPHVTQTILTCEPPIVTLSKDKVHCIAKVNDTATSGAAAPTGEVVFSHTNEGSFSPTTKCTLASSAGAGTASCALQYIPAHLGAHKLTASYGGDVHDQASRDGAQVQVVQAVGVAPNTTLKKKPRRKTARRLARFRFVSDQPGSNFQCKLDRRAFRFRPCRSPFGRRVRLGRHVFRVRAINSQGIADPTPAIYRWKVLKRVRRRPGA
jgi:DNA-binding beta-propeller fold protein YncE